MLTLYIVPPGRTDYSPYGELLGINNPPLSLEGVKYCEMVSEKIKPLILEAVISGPLKREFVTGKIIGSPHNLPVRTERNLRDVNYGRWSGKTMQALSQEEPKLFNKLRSTPGKFKFPSGDKVKKGWRRVREFTYQFRLNFGTGNVVIVTDDFVSMMIASQLTRTPLENLEPWKSSEGELSIIKLDQDKWAIDRLRGEPFKK
ncbi:MAG: histidine phosphatase family protein [Thermoplasmata archaeon]|nr:histidine phosphatase family protein [Thermoplasmata archaeon]